jgi:arabinose-5-phosphate isomerase
VDQTHVWLEIAHAVLTSEAEAIAQSAERLDEGFVRAVELILKHPGKVIVTGVGKSGHIAQKISATLVSTGTPAVYLHASDAFHGDLGVYSAGDPTIMLSKSGTTQELLKLIPILRSFQSPIIAILGNRNSPLAGLVDVVLDATVLSEADPNNLAPTTSTTVALAMGDALACTLVKARGFTTTEYARYHPGGQLGRNLLLHVHDIAHSGEKVAWVGPDSSLKQVVIAMTKCPLGAACVVDAEQRLVGLITDGDLRRALTMHDDIRDLRASDVMTKNPTVVHDTAALNEALALMENRPMQISVLPVVRSSDATCLGLVRIHDIYHKDGA